MKPLPDIKKIAVFRALQLGDLLCAVPALRALRHVYPNAKIVLIGLPWARSFVKRFSPYINGFIHFPGYKGLPEQPYDPASFVDFQHLMRHEKFDLLIQMQGNGTIVNDMLNQSGALYLAGFHNAESRIPGNLFIEYPGYGPEIERHLALMKHLGIAARGVELEFPVDENDRKEIEVLVPAVTKQNYICVHPGSRGSWRQWPPQYFATLADYCAGLGFTIIVTGTGDELEITKELVKFIHHPVIDMTGQTSIGAMAALLENAAFLIANCTGVSHLADALKVPSFIISMDGEPERWSPLNRSLHCVIDWTLHPQPELVFQQAYSFIDSELKKPKHKVA